jgi:diketogulonate reductase-like aldo/keto reductase
MTARKLATKASRPARRRWSASTCTGAIPLPKATSAARQWENLAIFDFELSEHDMASIARLASPNGRTHDQDPVVYEGF